MVGIAQWSEPPELVVRARLPARVYLVEVEPGSFAPTMDRAEATHAHGLDPVSGDIVVEEIASANGVRATAFQGDVTLYGY